MAQFRGFAARAHNLPPFQVMRILARAQALEAAGRDVIHMEVGEPDFPTPAPILEAAQHYLGAGQVRYTPALGLPALREAIARHYQDEFGLDIGPERVAVTAGASGALLLALALLTDVDDEWLMADPGYPCNRQFVSAFNGIARTLSCGADTGFQPRPAQVEAAWSARSRGLLLATPANPTGSVLSAAELEALHTSVRARGGQLIVDEIYQGLWFDTPPHSALALGETVFVVNSFSKYFGMTGWRLGWLVGPAAAIREIEKLAQHYFIAPSAPAQHAALAAFLPQTRAILEQRRLQFQTRRNALLTGLDSLGLRPATHPAGAFYAYVDLGQQADSLDFALKLLEQTGVATTPGCDFGTHESERHLRLAYTTSLARIDEALARIDAWRSNLPPSYR